jgi:hypothetical protein
MPTFTGTVDVVTVTSAGPAAAPAGVTAVNVVPPASTLTSVAGTPAKKSCGSPEKLPLAIVTDVPPACGPLAGVIVIDAGGVPAVVSCCDIVSPLFPGDVPWAAAPCGRLRSIMQSAATANNMNASQKFPNRSVQY